MHLTLNILPTILVVDDNADMQDYINSILLNNFNVITAHNGVDALHKMKETEPVLVLTNIILPVMDGIGLLKEIKSNKATANIPVIFLTARAVDESIIGGWETGADDYLVKPFSEKELLARVGAQIKLVKLRQSLEGKVRNLLMEAPAIICVLQGPQHVFELANEIYLQLIGKKDVLGKTVLEVMPELVGQGYLELLDNVYATGEPYIGNETPAQIEKGNGKLEDAFFNFVYQPTHNSEGIIDGVLLFGVDVTEQVLARKKIEKSKNQLQNIFLNAPAAIAIFEGPQHKYILANKAYEKLSNRKAADLLGKSMEVLFPELLGTGTLELFDNVLKTGESFSTPEYALMLDLNNEGVLRRYDFNFSMEPLKNSSGEIYAVMAMTYDITEQVEARKRIDENEKQQAFLLKLSDAIKELIDPVDIQLTACRILGEHVKVNRVLYGEVINEEQIILNNNYVNGVSPIIATLNAEQFGRNVIDAFKRNEKIIISDINNDPAYTEAERQNFLSLDVVANAGMGLIKGGRWVAAFGMHCNAPRVWTASEIWLLEETADRTWAAVERAKAEQALRKSEEKYRNLFTSIDQGFAFCELVRNNEGKGIDYYMLELNPSYETQTGLSAEMMLGKTILQVFPTIDKVHIDTFAAVVDNQCPVIFEQYFEVNHRWHEVKVYPGEKDKFTVLFSNITERKLAEEKLKESERLLEQNVIERTKQLEEKNIELQRLNKELEAFTYVSSHDLQEPLRKIQAFAGQIIATEYENLSENAKEYFGRMQLSATRMQALIQDLLAFSRLNTSERIYEHTVLKKIVDEVKEEFKESIEEKNAVLTIGEMCEVNIIPFQFRQLMHNLISNALKFSKQDVPLHIMIESKIVSVFDSPLKSPKTCHITVTDNGIGFKKQYAEKIFEVFQKLHVKEKYAGTGIGLAIVKKIVENHNGMVTAESELGKGTRFNIYIPA